MMKSTEALLHLDTSEFVGKLSEEVRRVAEDYYPDWRGQPLEVRVKSCQRRPLSRLFEFELQGPTAQRHILAKASLSAQKGLSAGSDDTLHSYFRGAPDPPNAEFLALKTYEQYLEHYPDPSLFAVRPIDSLYDNQVLLLERVDAMSLNDLLRSATRFGKQKQIQLLLNAMESAVAACVRYIRCRLGMGGRREAVQSNHSSIGSC